jgi:methylthioribose-1-phosphate isomerase
MHYTSIKIKDKRLYYLDQRLLPSEEKWRECRDTEEGFKTIRELGVRGAPLIGVFAGYCIAVYARSISGPKETFLNELKKHITYLKSARPTAVNLSWSLNRIEKTVQANKQKTVKQIREAVFNEARAIHEEDIRLCENMANHGISLIKPNDTVLTHCNTGFLATSGRGTALSVIFKAHTEYGSISVYADESRPLLQGARLTSWELTKANIPHKIICDSMAAYCMQQGLIDKVFLGADRIAANGDTANKIGTYNVAVNAKYHNIPFYVVAPFSTFDLTLKNGSEIPIEERNADEVRTVLGKVQISPRSAEVYNPAFDITPYSLISAIVSDRGIIYPTFTENIKECLEKA